MPIKRDSTEFHPRYYAFDSIPSISIVQPSMGACISPLRAVFNTMQHLENALFTAGKYPFSTCQTIIFLIFFNVLWCEI